jgi:myo-inositol 2-dehydrogenase/D-chiro-inositol 1-dehydrogenase
LVKKALQLGLIGIGKAGQKHLAALKSIKDAGLLDIEINAICDTDDTNLKRIALEYGIPVFYSNPAFLIRDENVDIVYVCTPGDMHADLVKEVALAGKAVYCEEPLARSCPQAREMNAVALDSAVPTSSGMTLRYDPFFIYAKQLLGKYDFGKPLLAHIREDQQFPLDQESLEQERSETSIPGGGILLHQSIQVIDVLTMFFGDVATVYAQVGYHGGYGVEDQASIIMKHNDGTTSTLDSLWHHLDRPDERIVEFFFENGFIGITLESGNNHLDYHLRGEGPVRVHPQSAEAALLDELELSSNNLALGFQESISNTGINKQLALSYSFLKAVASGNTPSPSFMDALSAHRIVDAAYESFNNKTPIDIL